MEALPQVKNQQRKKQYKTPNKHERRGAHPTHGLFFNIKFKFNDQKIQGESIVEVTKQAQERIQGKNLKTKPCHL